MKGVMLSGAAIAVVDGVVLGVALGVDRLSLATAALAVGLVAAFVLGLVTPAREVPDAVVATGGTLITLGTRPTPEPADPVETPDGFIEPPPISAVLVRVSLPAKPDRAAPLNGLFGLERG